MDYNNNCTVDVVMALNCELKINEVFVYLGIFNHNRKL